MLADDALGATRERPGEPLAPAYVDAFSAIQDDPNNELVVVDVEGKLAGVMQLTFIPYLSHTGTWRCLIEGVRIARAHRGQGLGGDMIRWAIERARQRGCGLVQLTSDKQRPDALRFYGELGFVASHEGFKLKL
ncbi:MAG: GNAT family N-acetyltransferase [Gammaproteobacteria bacterium]|nr:GNAT family N-acetyltransferase [Gammaproteobacteria bacterium]